MARHFAALADLSVEAVEKGADNFYTQIFV